MGRILPGTRPEVRRFKEATIQFVSGPTHSPLLTFRKFLLHLVGGNTTSRLV